MRPVSHFTPTLPVVSVLMVAHDAEKNVRRAVESIQNQSLKNLELIVVDAGSSDSTARQLASLAERDLRIEVVRADGCDRQEGLDLALERSRGTYVTVMDADGWARPGVLDGLVGMATEKSLDLVVGGFTLSVRDESGRGGEWSVTSEGASYLTQHEFRAGAWRLFASGQLLPASAKLFSQDLIAASGARFGSDLGSDHAFVIAALRDVERVGVLGGECYHLDRSVRSRRRADAALGDYRRLEREHEALLDLYRHWGLDGDAASLEMLQNRYIEQLVGCIEEVCGSGGLKGSAEQRDAVARMLGTEHARLAASVAHPRGSHARSMLAPIRARSVPLVCAQARLLSLVWGGQPSSAVPDVFI